MTDERLVERDQQHELEWTQIGEQRHAPEDEVQQIEREEQEDRDS
jgi:hypothetical protein